VITRREYGEGALGYFKYAAEIFGTVGCETSIAPVLGIVGNVGNTSYPNNGKPGKFTANGYCEAALLDHWVPLQHMVYHGLTSYGGGPEVAGRTGTEFSAPVKREQVVELKARYDKHRAWTGPLDYAFMIDHRTLEGGAVRTTLSDGTRIYVNKSAQPWSGEGVTLEPGAHAVKRP
jgi:hypothetical protein